MAVKVRNVLQVPGSRGPAEDFDVRKCYCYRVETGPMLACTHLHLRGDSDRRLLQGPGSQVGQGRHRDSLAPVPNGEG